MTPAPSYHPSQDDLPLAYAWFFEDRCIGEYSPPGAVMCQIFFVQTAEVAADVRRILREGNLPLPRG